MVANGLGAMLLIASRRAGESGGFCADFLPAFFIAGPGSEGLTTEPSHQDRERSGTQRTDRRCYHVRISSLSKPSPGRHCSLGPPCKLAGPARCHRSAKQSVAYSPHTEDSLSRFSFTILQTRDVHVKSLPALLPLTAHPALPIVWRGHRTARAPPNSGPTHTGGLLR